MPLTFRERKLVNLAGLALAFALLLLAIYHRRADTVTLALVEHGLSDPAGTDSTFYMRLGERSFQEYGPRLYRELFFTQHQKFIYPPSSLFLIEAVDRLPALGISATSFWKALMLFSWVGSVLLGVLHFRQASEDQQQRVSLLEAGCIALLGVLFLPFAEALFRGQIQMLLTMLFGLSSLLYAKRAPGWAGVVLALTCAFKPQLGVFLLWGIFRKEWRFTMGFLLGGGAIAVASLARFGFQNHLDYLAVLSVLSRHGEALAANQSMLGAVDRFLRNGDAATWSYTVYPPYRASVYLVSTLFSLLCLAIGLLVPWSTGWCRTTSDFLLFGCLSVFMSPIAWEHHYGYFFFVIAVLLARSTQLRSSAWAAMSAALLLTANRLAMLDGFVQGVNSLLGDYLLLAGMVILGLLVTSTGLSAAVAGCRRGVADVAMDGLTARRRRSFGATF